MPFIKNISVLKCKVAVSSVAVVNCDIAAGSSHSLAIDSSGMIWRWGSGQGAGSTTALNSTTPYSIAGAKKTFCKITAGGSNFNHAIDKNGIVWGWGNGVVGKIGDNASLTRNTPVSIYNAATKTFCQISDATAASFGTHVLAIDKNGKAWAWGGNSSGQLGDNTLINKCTPVSIAGAAKTFCQIAAGGSHSLAIDKNGQVWAWGGNIAGQLGDNTAVRKCTPVSIAGAAKTFCQIAASDSHSLAIDKNGRVWAWGLNATGQLGDNTTTGKYTPVSIAGAAKTFCQIAAGSSHSLAIDKNGRVWAWGLNASGQLGDNTLTLRFTPVSILGTAKTFCKIAAGSSHSLAIDYLGKVWAWGSNAFAQLGDDTITSKLTPVSILGATKTFCQIAGRQSTSLAIDYLGRVWGWGGTIEGEIGDNSEILKLTPVSIYNAATKTFCQISTGGNNNHSLGIDNLGQVWAWGRNSSGQLGDNTTISKRTPVSIAGAAKTFCQIAAGSSHSLAIDYLGKVWAWGGNTNGQLADNTTTARCTPVSIAGAAKTFCQITAGGCHSLAIDYLGKVWVWGGNQFGQLGDNTTISKLTPVSIAGAKKTFCKIAAGQTSSLAIDYLGQVWAWGRGDSGQIGDNNTVSRRTPVSIYNAATKTFCEIFSTIGSSFAIDYLGRVWAWGQNSVGQLGNNLTGGTTRTPVSIYNAATKTFCKIAGGPLHTVAIDYLGRVWVWGTNASNQLGVNKGTRLTPVRVCVI